MKRNGFTLIELLAVIILVALLAGIGIPSIMKIIQDRKNKLYESTVEELKNIAKVYATNDPDIYSTVDVFGSTYVQISTLCEKKFIDCPVLDPRNNSEMTGSIKISLEDNEYSYEYTSFIPNINQYSTNKDIYEELVSLDERLRELEENSKDKLKTIKSNLTDAENSYTNAINSNLSLKSYPIGSIYISYSSTNPGTLIGGTWQAFAPGRVLVGVNESNTNFNESGKTGGSKTITYTPQGQAASHVLTTAEIPAHTHGSVTLTGYANMRRYGTSGTGTDIVVNSPTGILSRSDIAWSGSHGLVKVGGKSLTNPYYDIVTINLTHTHDSIGSNTGHTHGFTGTQATLNVMQPYTTVYMWKRTA